MTRVCFPTLVHLEVNQLRKILIQNSEIKAPTQPVRKSILYPYFEHLVIFYC